MSDSESIGELGDAFHHVGTAAVAWVTDYLATIAQRPVAASVEPGEIAERLSSEPPVAGEPIEVTLERLSRDLLPGITHWNHPRFFAYVPQSAPPPAMAADLIVSALNVNGLLWKTSPTLTELEHVVLGWLAKLLALPGTWFGQMQESASMGTLTALAVARERHQRRTGPTGRIVCSREAHASVQKAARVLGLQVTTTAVDASGRMLLEPVEAELARGGVSAVVATVGTTSSAAVDPIRAVGEACRQRRVWLHVDGAYASAAAICPELAHVLDGIEAADSFVINAHKWLGVTAPCSCLYTPHREELYGTFATEPSYLDKDEGQPNLVDYGPMFSRRLSALKLWFTMHASGTEQLQAGIRRVIELAGELALLIDADPDWDLLTQSFGVLCFRLRAPEQANLQLLRGANRDGRIFMSRTRLAGVMALRLAIGNHMTRRNDVMVAWDVLQEYGRQILADGVRAGATDPA